MWWVGLMGGTTLVNSLALILGHQKLAFNEKEAAIGIASFCEDCGILSATIISVILDHTFFQETNM